MCNLSLQSIQVTNFRKFEEASYRLNPQMNVFIGKNGSGKTAILEASNIILSAYLVAFKKYVSSKSFCNISKNDPRLKPQRSNSSGMLTTGGIKQYPCKVSCSLEWGQKNNIISFQRIVEKEEARTKFDGSNPMQPMVSTWEEQISQADHSDHDLTLPLVLYLSSARLWNEGKATSKESGVYSRTDAYDRCLDAKHGITMAFNYIDMLQSVAAEERDGKAFPAYDAILEAINFALRDELGSGESVIFSTRYEKDIVALKNLEGTIVPFSTMSDGYRNVIKIVLDIATRMCILNPYLEGDALKYTPGIVVIDEIDLSLHPTWQKRIVGILKSLFPKIQFICATHSPFIIQSLEDGELFNLDANNAPDTGEYSGESIEDIAEDIMGVEMPQYSEKKIQMYEAAKRFFDAVQNSASHEDVEKLRQKLALLEAQYDDNPAYLALLQQKYILKEMEVNHNETHQ